MKYCLFLLATILLSAQELQLPSVRKVQLTGSKISAIHSGERMLHRYTCLEAVATPEEADAVVDLEYGTITPARDLPKVEPGGLINCYSNGNQASCSDGSITSVVTCGGRGGAYSCSSYSYDSQALLEGVHALAQAADQAMKRKIYTHAYLLDRNGKSLVWDFDEGLHLVGALHDQWWEQLNLAVGCGKTRFNYKKHE